MLDAPKGLRLHIGLLVGGMRVNHRCSTRWPHNPCPSYPIRRERPRIRWKRRWNLPRWGQSFSGYGGIDDEGELGRQRS